MAVYPSARVEPTADSAGTNIAVHRPCAAGRSAVVRGACCVGTEGRRDTSLREYSGRSLRHRCRDTVHVEVVRARLVDGTKRDVLE